MGSPPHDVPRDAQVPINQKPVRVVIEAPLTGKDSMTLVDPKSKLGVPSTQVKITGKKSVVIEIAPVSDTTIYKLVHKRDQFEDVLDSKTPGRLITQAGLHTPGPPTNKLQVASKIRPSDIPVPKQPRDPVLREEQLDFTKLKVVPPKKADG